MTKAHTQLPSAQPNPYCLMSKIYQRFDSLSKLVNIFTFGWQIFIFNTNEAGHRSTATCQRDTTPNTITTSQGTPFPSPGPHLAVAAAARRLHVSALHAVHGWASASPTPARQHRTQPNLSFRRTDPSDSSSFLMK